MPPAQTEVQLGSVLVKPLASNFGDCKPGRLLCNSSDRTLVDQSVKRIGQSTVVQAGSRGRIKILERHTGGPVLGG